MKKIISVLSGISIATMVNTAKEINAVMAQFVAQDKNLPLAKGLILAKMAYDSKGAGPVENAVIAGISAIDLKKHPLAIYALGPIKSILTYKRKGVVRALSEDAVFGLASMAVIR